MQTFPTSDYLIKNNFFDKIRNKIESKNGENIFFSFELSKNIISTFSELLLIGQNDSLDVLLLDEKFLAIKKGTKLPDPYFGGQFDKWKFIHVMH